jgi:hypothetical protein
MTLMIINRLRPLPGPGSPTWRGKRYGLDVAALCEQAPVNCLDILPHVGLKSSGIPTPALTLCSEVPL